MLRLEFNFSPGSLDRLRRIQVLKGYTEQQAIDFAISMAWYATETRQDIPIPLEVPRIE